MDYGEVRDLSMESKVVKVLVGWGVARWWGWWEGNAGIFHGGVIIVAYKKTK